MDISKAIPVTGEEWCSNAMMQVSGKWLGLLLHHVLFPTWGSAGTGWAQLVRAGPLLGGQVSVVWERVACCSSAIVSGPRCVSPSVIDVSPRDLTHRSPAAGLAAAGRARWSTQNRSELKWGLNLLRAAALILFFFFGESRDWDTTCFLSSVSHLSLLPLFTSVCFSVADWEKILERRNTGAASIYASYVFVFESELLYYCYLNNTPGPLFPGAARMKRHLFFQLQGL